MFEAKRPSGFQITAGTIQQERKEKEERGKKAKTQLQKQLQSKKPVTIYTAKFDLCLRPGYHSAKYASAVIKTTK